MGVQDAVGSVLNQLSSNPDLTRLSLPAVFQDAIARLSQVVAFAMTSSENEEVAPLVVQILVSVATDNVFHLV